MDVNISIKERNFNDKSLKDMVLYGVNVGTYRNDIFCAFDMTSDTVVANYEEYICNRLATELGMNEITSADDIIKANSILKNRMGCDIAAWAEKWMNEESHWELIKDEG